MGRYFIELSYNGAKYHGWQTQPGVPTVQKAIEDALAMALRRPTPVVGAGRTDTGVNALAMMAHADLPDMDEKTAAKLIGSLNSILRRDIVIRKLIPVPDNAHARFDASSRTYRYFIHHSPSPFLNDFSLYCRPLDYEKMNLAAGHLLHVTDFTSFAKLHSDTRTNICHVSEAQWIDIGQDRHTFVITADRFLRNMVRAIVGTLIEVGRGKMSLDGFAEVISRHDRCAAGTSVPPHPLFLWSVTYPFIPRETDCGNAYDVTAL